jgi:hypothetical protein
MPRPTQVRRERSARSEISSSRGAAPRARRGYVQAETGSRYQGSCETPILSALEVQVLANATFAARDPGIWG